VALQLRAPTEGSLSWLVVRESDSPPIHPTQHRQILSCKCIFHGILAAANASRNFELHFGAHSRLRANGARCHQLLSFPAFQHHNHSTQHRHSTDLSFVAYALDTAEGTPLRFSAYICFTAIVAFALVVVSRGIARQPPSHHQQLTIQHNNTTKPLDRISTCCISINDSKNCAI
jgi:hypothetical protein